MAKRIKIGEKVTGYLAFGLRGQKKATGIFRGFLNGKPLIDLPIVTRASIRKTVRATITAHRRVKI